MEFHCVWGGGGMSHEKIRKLVSDLSKFKPGAPLDKFITSAVFANFKNILPFAEITFEFPLTVLVGPNGSGKSSILHALWGMPFGKSPSRFWFSTKVDPINEDGALGIPHFFYRHWIKELKREVETRKVKGTKRMGYWEPARVSTTIGMLPMPASNAKDMPYRSKDRWTPTKRDVIYINFKCEFSAFDRFFYFADRQISLEKKQEIIFKDAVKLNRVIEGKLQSYKPGGKESVFEHRDLSEIELNWISSILGREYTQATYVLHRLYAKTEAPTVLFSRPDIQYSEAFAGSGELAIVRAVVQILGATQYSLILLDEPETSLHPGAQQRLLVFIMSMIKEKHIQVVMSSHSPTIVENLPSNAIKVLDGSEFGKTQILNNSLPSVAFNRLGHLSHGKFFIAVEDSLLSVLVEMAIDQLDPGEQQAFEVFVPPGGADCIKTYSIPTWISEEKDVYVILDGDQQPANPIPKVEDLTGAQIGQLEQFIHETYKVKPLHVSNSNPQSCIDYLKWVTKRVKCLEAICPEQVLLEALVGEKNAIDTINNNLAAKQKLVATLEKDGHTVTADLLVHSARFIIKNPETNKHIIQLKELLQGFLKDHNN
jgi:energy-coupling factor transporter ATP-binding protein EcfA2